jgi:uncharacterized membrane protein YjdF
MNEMSVKDFIGINRKGLMNVDIFVAFNVLLFSFMCVFVYYDRFIAYRGAEHVIEFFAYAVLIMGVIFISWRALRSYPFSNSLLLLIELGILMHFAGGLVQLHGTRLYNNYFFGLRYDKYVHFCNALFGAFIVKDFFDRRKMKLYSFTSLVVVLIVLGFGSVIEIVEYVVTKSVPHNGVGGYDNNMQDLIANLAGGLVYGFIEQVRTKMAGRHLIKDS